MWHSERVKLVNHKYGMICYIQKRLFTSILQNYYFESKNVMESFFRIKTFKSLKEVMESFFNIKNFKSRKQVMHPYFSIKILRIVRK